MTNYLFNLLLLLFTYLVNYLSNLLTTAMSTAMFMENTFRSTIRKFDLYLFISFLYDNKRNPSFIHDIKIKIDIFRYFIN